MIQAWPAKSRKPLKRRCDTPERALGAVITDLRVKREWPYRYVAEQVGCDDPCTCLNRARDREPYLQGAQGHRRRSQDQALADHGPRRAFA